MLNFLVFGKKEVFTAEETAFLEKLFSKKVIPFLKRSKSYGNSQTFTFNKKGKVVSVSVNIETGVGSINYNFEDNIENIAEIFSSELSGIIINNSFMKILLEIKRNNIFYMPDVQYRNFSQKQNHIGFRTNLVASF